MKGLNVKHLSYARAASSDADKTGEASPEKEMQSLEDQVVLFLESKSIEINRENISACHTLGKGSQNDPPKVIMRFSNRKEKVSLLRQRRNLEGTQVYVNEHLTQRNAQIARHARVLRNNGDIESTWVRSCNILIKLNDGTVKKVSNAQTFEDLDLPAFVAPSFKDRKVGNKQTRKLRPTVMRRPSTETK